MTHIMGQSLFWLLAAATAVLALAMASALGHRIGGAKNPLLGVTFCMMMGFGAFAAILFLTTQLLLGNAAVPLAF